MRYELFVALKYFLHRRREKFISAISLISILGVAVGVMTLIVVIAVMSGASSFLKEKVIGAHAHVVVGGDAGIDNPEQVIEDLREVPGVISSSPFIDGRVMLRTEELVINVAVRGIDPAREAEVNKLAEYVKKGSFTLADDEVILGSELFERLGTRLGDKVALISPLDGRVMDFRVGGVFNTGRYDYDIGMVLLNLVSTRKLFDLPEAIVSGIGVKIDNAYSAGKLKQAILRKLKFAYPVRTWMDMDRSLFASLKLEKTAMFIILTMIVVVAALNIASSLIMMVMEKTRDIGILKAIGADNSGIKLIFTIEGMFIGVIGTVLGAAGGFFICYLLKNYEIIKLPPDVYYIDRLPVKVNVFDSALIIVAALIICLAATLYPSRQAARLNPADALRYE